MQNTTQKVTISKDFLKEFQKVTDANKGIVGSNSVKTNLELSTAGSASLVWLAKTHDSNQKKILNFIIETLADEIVEEFRMVGKNAPSFDIPAQDRDTLINDFFEVVQTYNDRKRYKRKTYTLEKKQSDILIELEKALALEKSVIIDSMLVLYKDTLLDNSFKILEVFIEKYNYLTQVLSFDGEMELHGKYCAILRNALPDYNKMIGSVTKEIDKFYSYVQYIIHANARRIYLASDSEKRTQLISFLDKKLNYFFEEDFFDYLFKTIEDNDHPHYDLECSENIDYSYETLLKDGFSFDRDIFYGEEYDED